MFHYVLIFGLSSHITQCWADCSELHTSKELLEQATWGPILVWHNLVKLLLNSRWPWSDTPTRKGVTPFKPFHNETWYTFPAMSFKLYYVQQVVTKGSFLITMTSIRSAFIQQCANTDEVIQRLNFWISRCTHHFYWKSRKHNPNITYYLHLWSRIFAIMYTE